MTILLILLLFPEVPLHSVSEDSLSPDEAPQGVVINREDVDASISENMDLEDQTNKTMILSYRKTNSTTGFITINVDR